MHGDAMLYKVNAALTCREAGSNRAMMLHSGCSAISRKACKKINPRRYTSVSPSARAGLKIP